MNYLEVLEASSDTQGKNWILQSLSCNVNALKTGKDILQVYENRRPRTVFTQLTLNPNLSRTNPTVILVSQFVFCHLRLGLPIGLFPQVLLPKYVYILIYELKSEKWESVGLFCNSYNKLSAPRLFKFCVTVGEHVSLCVGHSIDWI